MNASELGVLAAAVGLPIDPEYRESVARFVTDLLGAAEFLARFPLDESSEPSGVFRP